MSDLVHVRVHQLNVSSGGIPKRPIERARLSFVGLEGDGHTDRVGHRGGERALCLFALETIRRLQAEGHTVFPGALGENVTTEGLDFSTLEPGTRLRIGKALAEITSYTTPCTNVAGAFRARDFMRIFHQRHPGDSRLYARVLEPAEVATGDPIQVVEPQWTELAASRQTHSP